MKGFRAIDEKHEHGGSEVARDTRPLGVRAAEALSDPMIVLAIEAGVIIAMIAAPFLVDVLFLSFLILFIYSYTRKPTLPFKLPAVSGALDYNDTIPGTAKARKAAGIFFLGNEYNTNKELWFSNDDMRTHVLVVITAI